MEVAPQFQGSRRPELNPSSQSLFDGYRVRGRKLKGKLTRFAR
jgi:hypothetical protein